MHQWLDGSRARSALREPKLDRLLAPTASEARQGARSCTPSLLLQDLLSSIVLAPAPTQAQVSVDVSKITCDQYVHAKIATPLYLAAWLSGYYNAKRNNVMVDLQTLEENATKVQNYCYDEKNFKVPVMKAVERVLGGRK
jgi:acid stress chaperone HdeB